MPPGRSPAGPHQPGMPRSRTRTSLGSGPYAAATSPASLPADRPLSPPRHGALAAHPTPSDHARQRPPRLGRPDSSAAARRPRRTPRPPMAPRRCQGSCGPPPATDRRRTRPRKLHHLPGASPVLSSSGDRRVLLSLCQQSRVFRWQRRDSWLARTDPAATRPPGCVPLRMPTYRSMISMTNWLIGGVVFIAASWPVASHAAPVWASPPGGRDGDVDHRLPAVRSGCCGPVAVAALRGGVPENFRAPGVIQRQVLTWVLSTGVPCWPSSAVRWWPASSPCSRAPADQLNTPIPAAGHRRPVVG